MQYIASTLFILVADNARLQLVLKSLVLTVTEHSH